MKIKKLLKICFIAMGLSLSSISLAENYNLTNVANTCAPWEQTDKINLFK